MRPESMKNNSTTLLHEKTGYLESIGALIGKYSLYIMLIPGLIILFLNSYLVITSYSIHYTKLYDQIKQSKIVKQCVS